MSKPGYCVIAILDDGKFEFIAGGGTVESAGKYLARAYRKHVDQLPHHVAHATKITPKWLEEYYGVRYVRMGPGLASRDGEDFFDSNSPYEKF